MGSSPIGRAESIEFMTDYILTFVSEQKFSLVIFYLLIVTFALYVRHRGLKNYQDYRSVVTQYDPPTGISPVFSRYLVTGGRLGGTFGEISVSGLQTIMLIDLYEHGALDELKFIDKHTLSYKVVPNYKDKNLFNDSVIFLDHLVSKVGNESTLNEEVNSKEKNYGNGYSGINNFWNTYYYKDLFDLSVRNGYVNKNNVFDYFVSWFSVSVTFGVFFSIFLMFIPVVGYFIIAVLLAPILFIFAISIFLNIALQQVLNTNFIFEYLASNSPELYGLLAFIVPVIAFLTWIIMFMILANSTKKALFRITQSGKDIVLYIKGYEQFLKTTDLDRLSYSIDRDPNFIKKSTSFEWLAVFGIAKDEHWRQFYEIHGMK